MASDVEICNLALSHLGDTANVTSIDPPEGSAQAEHCSRFYPVARGMLIEAHDWSWATRRISLTPLVATVSPWAYAYGKPNLMIKAIAVLDPEASDDYTIPATFETEQAYLPLSYAPLTYAPHASRPFLAWSTQHHEAITVTRFDSSGIGDPKKGHIAVINGRTGKWFWARHWMHMEPPQ